MISKAASPVLLVVLLAACAATAPQPSALPHPQPQPQSQTIPDVRGFATVADSLIRVGLRETQWGIEVWDQSRNQSVFSHDAERHFVPASNTKLVVTTTALGLLGPDWRYATPVMLAGAPGDSAPGALIIQGSGDPAMSGRFFGSDFAVLDSMADSLAAKGVRRIAGDVVIDARIFTPQRIHSAWEIGDLPWYYATPTASFAVGEAAVRMIVTPNDVRFVDAFAPIPVARRLRTDTAGARNNVDIDYEIWPDTLVITGSIAANSADSSWIAEPDPEMFAARALVEALRRKSIAVTGNVRVLRDSAAIAALPTAHTAFTWHSPPMRDIVAGILKPSQNWIAEQLLKTLGAVKGGGGTWRDGLMVERRYLIDVVHIDSLAFSLSDGSGLSAQNVVSPRAFVMLLEHARRAPWGADYRAALPVPGMRGATLSTRLAGLETRLAAKTGSIANVNSLSGYVRTAGGRDLTFSILSNASGRSSAEVRRGIDAFVQALARDTSH